MPIARLGLAPEHRIFYDTLVDYGDWILIEPHGYVFRPRIAFESWNPYADGFWVPTEIYGWVWISREPFGWATYHYGRWLADPFQGWVWAPGTDWGPGWVTWTGSSGFVGWAPLPPSGYDLSSVPSSGYNYVETSSLTATDLKGKLVPAEQAIDGSALREISNIDQVDGVRFNRGPDFETVERVTGPLVKVEIENVVPGQPVDVTSGVTVEPVADPVKATQRAAIKVTQRAREASKGVSTGVKFPQVKLLPSQDVTKRKIERKTAKRDSTR